MLVHDRCQSGRLPGELLVKVARVRRSGLLQRQIRNNVAMMNFSGVSSTSLRDHLLICVLIGYNGLSKHRTDQLHFRKKCFTAHQSLSTAPQIAADQFR